MTSWIANTNRTLRMSGKTSGGSSPKLRPLMLEQLESRQLFAYGGSDLMIFTVVNVVERIDNTPIAWIESYSLVRQNDFEYHTPWGHRREVRSRPEGEGHDAPSDRLFVLTISRSEPLNNPKSNQSSNVSGNQPSNLTRDQPSNLSGNKPSNLSNNQSSNPTSAVRNNASLDFVVPIAATLNGSRPQSSARPSSGSIPVEFGNETTILVSQRTTERNETVKPQPLSTAVGIGMQINDTKAIPFQNASNVTVQLVSQSEVVANRLENKVNSKSSPNMDAFIYRKSVSEIEVPEPLGMTRLLFNGSVLTTRNDRVGKQSPLPSEQRNAFGSQGKSEVLERPISLLGNVDSAFTQLPIPHGMVYLDWFAPTHPRNASLAGEETTSRIQFAGTNPLAVMQIFVGTNAFGLNSTNKQESTEGTPPATPESFEPTPALVDLAWGRFDSLLFAILGGGVACYYSLQPKGRSRLQNTRIKRRIG